MPGRIAVDFGTSNTVVAGFDPVRRQGVVLALPEYGRCQELIDEQVSSVPSLIHYGAAGQIWYGNEVIQRNLTHSGRSFHWMKRYICRRHSATRKIDGQNISYAEAGQAFLSRILSTVRQTFNPGNEEIALTLPVEAFEHYENWLYAVAQQAGLGKVRFVDEPSAAALGYSTRLFPEEACLVFDFGAGGLSVSIVQQEFPDSAGNQRCRVLGKSGADLGGSMIDEWIFRDLVGLHGYVHKDREIQAIGKLFLAECQMLKERLSVQEKSTISVMNPATGALFSSEYSREQLENLLQSNGGYAVIDSTLQLALADCRERGFAEDKIKTVLMVGGCSLIPGIQSRLAQMFGSQRLRVDRPLDAVARGAACFISGQSFDDYLQHDYALRYRNAGTQKYEYRQLVKRGCKYPTAEPLASITVKAVSDAQEEFMMQIFEIGRNVPDGTPVLEVIFDDDGNAHVKSLTKDELDERNMFWINEKNPTLLRADPPATKGEDRFQVYFAVDSSRRLAITTRDLKTGRIVYQDFPVLKLS